MKTLHKTLTVLLLAAGGLSLTGAAQAHDRVTVIYSSSDYHRPPALYWKHRPPVHVHRYDDRRYAHRYVTYRGKGWQHKYRDRDWYEHRRHDDRRSDARPDRDRYPVYGKGDRH